MLDDVTELSREPEIRRAAVRDEDDKLDVELLQKAVASSIKDTVDWYGPVEFSKAAERLDRRELLGKLTRT